MDLKKMLKNMFSLKHIKKKQIFKKKRKNFIFLHKVSLLRNLKIFPLIDTKIRRKRNIYINESINKYSVPHINNI